jgi:uncharacterized repeat protein (TIGR03943 family)
VNRETENTLLLLLGLSTAIITVTGTFTRYVKPSLLPWLAATAILLVVLAVSAMLRDRQHQTDPDGGRADDHGHPDGHPHRSAIGWLLVLPVIVLAFVVPPALGAWAATPSVVTVSAQELRQPFPPLPAERAPEVSLKEVLKRVTLDSAGTLNGRLITLVGFTLHDGDATDLARIAIFCCAADAQLARIHLEGPAAPTRATFPENTWLHVEGVVLAEPADPAAAAVPTMTVSTVTRIDAPANTYAY